MDFGTRNATLLSGNTIPLVGLGTYSITGLLVHQVLDLALRTGYRLIDSAQIYNNEKEIGIALKVLLPKYNLKREDVFITSKLGSYGPGINVDEEINKSLQNLGLKYLDAYLIHAPVGWSQTSVIVDNRKMRNETWHAFINAHRDGRIKSIGVSNFQIKHIEELIEDSGVKPDINQFEFHPYWHQFDLLEYCHKQGIFFQAYSPLGTGSLLKDSTVKAIANKLKKSPAQVLIKWGLQQGVGTVPKATSQAHLENNLDLDFIIPDDDMKTLSSLTVTEKYAFDSRATP